MTDDLQARIRDAHMEYLRRVRPHHGELHRYARGLTGCVFRAEDLCQEAVVRTFVRLGQGGDQPQNLRAYLFRVITNVWRDEGRRRQSEALSDDVPDDDPPPLGAEVIEALEKLVTGLPPRERAAVLLADVFAFSLADAADALDTTVGAVKAALHRGRTRLNSGVAAPVPAKSTVDAARVRDLVDAFNARDVQQMLALMTADAEVDLLGVFRTRRPEDRELVVSKTFEDRQLLRAEVVEYGGEPIVLLWHEVQGRGLCLGEILRVETEGDRVSRTRWYYFCPDTIAAVARDLGVEVSTHGFHGLME